MDDTTRSAVAAPSRNPTVAGRMLRRAGIAFVALAATAVLIEIGARLSGAVDFPVYRLDSEFGYFPRANQAGAFLNRNRWVYNDRAIGVPRRWDPSAHVNLLVIGNSIVAGGNPVDQSDRVATLVQRGLGDAYAVWPVAAGGWNMTNETRYLQQNPDLADGADLFVWEFLSDAFGEPAPWPGDTLRPTERPLIATTYLFRKYVFDPWAAGWRSPPLRVASADQNLREFELVLSRLHRSGTGPAGVLLLYPELAAVNDLRRGIPWPKNRALLERLASAHDLLIVDLSRDPRWTAGLYRDPVHPTVEGNRIIAGAMVSAIREVVSKRRDLQTRTSAGTNSPTSP